MEWDCFGRRAAALAALALLAVMAGCGGSHANAPPPQSPAPQPATQGTGLLKLSVADSEGRPLAEAQIGIYSARQRKFLTSASTDTDGLATLVSLPATVVVTVGHEFGNFRSGDVQVPQSGTASLGVTVAPNRPRPSVALLPVEIRAGSLSADRNELTLQFTIVASASTPLAPASYGDYSRESTPSLGLELGENANDSRRECWLWLDRRHPVPACNTWGESPYTVVAEQLTYTVASAAPLPASPDSGSTMLLMDTSRRVSALDPGAFRSFAARRFIERLLTADSDASLSLAGFASLDGNPVAPLSLPTQPIWSPLGAGALFLADPGIVKTGVGILEPLAGGAAPVFEAVATAVALTTSNARHGNRTVVTLLGGGDDGALSNAQRDAALASLRQQRDATGVRSILIDAAAQGLSADHRAIAELAAALRAPAISLGATPYRRFTQSWASGSYAALDFAAELIEGTPLPTLTAAFRVKANAAGAFAAGTRLHGVVYVESDICDMGCAELPLAFAVEIP